MCLVVMAGQCSSPDPAGGLPADHRGAAAWLPHGRLAEECQGSLGGEMEAGADGAERRQDGGGGAGGRTAE